MQENVHSQEELFEIIKKMRETNSQFYASAVKTGCHPFIEFCGIMHEYIELCANAAKSNVDFTQANTHSEIALPIMPYQMNYLAEKLDCIFGPSLRSDSAIKEVFFKAFDK